MDSADSISSNLTEEQQQERKKLKCPICNCTFPNKEFYNSHHWTEAKIITNDLFEEFPQLFNSPLLDNIENKKREIKDIERQIEFIKERQQREAKFIEEQNRHEVEFRQEQERREIEYKKKIRERAYLMASGETPRAEGWKRLFSED
jgi:hypothetical protein